MQDIWRDASTSASSNPIAFIGAPLFLLAVAAAASLIPTREALKLDPMTTLRYD